MNYYRKGQPYRKNVLRVRKNRYGFKRLHVEPSHVFAYVGPDELYLTKSQRRWLIDRGYEIAEWEKGNMLVVNDKLTRASLRKAVRLVPGRGSAGPD